MYFSPTKSTGSNRGTGFSDFTATMAKRKNPITARIWKEKRDKQINTLYTEG